ncbi:MAG: hypothetical protein RLP45_09950 [Haliea sp.]
MNTDKLDAKAIQNYRPRRNKATGWKILAPFLFLFSFTEIAAAQIPANAARTIFLSNPLNAAESSVAYHPGFSQYDTSGIGTTSRPGFVYDNAGTLIHTEDPLNIDVRAINFNPNTGLLEVVTFGAVTGGVGRGLIEAQLDGSGLYTGGTATLLASMPGNDGSQTLPAYDPARDRFYSRGSSNTVNIVARSDGSLLGTITLDFATAGVASATNNALGFAPSQDWLIVTDSADDTAAIFDLSGDHVGTSALDVDVPGSYNIGFANGQLFVQTGEGYQGFDIGAGAPSASPPATIPTIGAYGLIFTAIGLFMLAVRRLSRS